MMRTFLVHEITRAYEAFGNTHLVFATVTGNTHPDGSDITEENLVLAMPASQLQKMIVELDALKEIEDSSSPVAQQEQDNVQESIEGEILGKPIFSGISRV